MENKNHSADTKRIARNTLMLYVRMLFGMLVSLYTSRVVLQALGVDDYGIQNVVGGFVSMFSIFSGSLSAAVSRFLTFELGRGNMERLRNTFSTSLNIHILLSVIIIILCETIGLWFLNNKMVIPVERIDAANIVFHSSVASFVLGLLSVSYNASIISHEKMGIFAFIGILDIIIRLFIVLFIAYSPFNFDSLVFYSLSLLGVSILMQIIYYIYCKKSFPECHYKFIIKWNLFKEVAGFAGWNFIGASSAVLRDHGGNLLLNLFFGLNLNTVRGISQQVNSAVNAFVGNFMVAMNPQITKAYASGDYSYMMSLIFYGARYSFYLLFILSLPIIINTDYILYIWLGDYPDHTVNFIRLVLIFSLSESISNPLVTSMLATGKIKVYQIIVGGFQMLNFPLSYIFLKLGFPPESILFVAIILSFCCLVSRLILLRKMILLPSKRFIKEVYFNVLLVSFISIVFPSFFICIFPIDGFGMFCLSTFICLISSISVIYFVGCNKYERSFILGKANAIYRKIIMR